MPSPLVMLPPSEGKRPGGTRRARRGAFDDELGAARLDVTTRLREVVATSSRAQLESIFGVRGPLFDRALGAMVALAHGEAVLRPVWQRYSGVVWSHLEPESLSAAQRRRLIVPSGLYGLNVGDDLIGDYRLKMTARLMGLSVAALWRPVIGKSLARYANGRVVYDLLPAEHRSVFNVEDLGATRVVAVSFRHGGDGRLAGHDAKAAKGTFARHLLETSSAESFSWRGWRARVEGARIDVLFDA